MASSSRPICQCPPNNEIVSINGFGGQLTYRDTNSHGYITSAYTDRVLNLVHTFRWKPGVLKYEYLLGALLSDCWISSIRGLLGFMVATEQFHPRLTRTLSCLRSNNA